jgi:hypothetical protein
MPTPNLLPSSIERILGDCSVRPRIARLEPAPMFLHLRRLISSCCVVASTVAFIAACGGGGATPGGIGSPCGNGCDPGLYCYSGSVTEFDGLCTESCTYDATTGNDSCKATDPNTGCLGSGICGRECGNGLECPAGTTCSAFGVCEQ